MGNFRGITAVFLQARLNSTRLAEKALLLLQNKSVLEHAMLSLKKIPTDYHVLLTDAASTELLKPIADDCGFNIFTGAADDVLLRFSDALEIYKVDDFIRATADNPLVSYEYAYKLLKLHIENKADYSGYSGLPLGCGVEVVKASSLKIADLNSSDPYEREHVSPYLYFREEQFKILRPKADSNHTFSDSRVTLDTLDDYRYISRIFADLYKGESVKIDDLLNWLKSDNKKGRDKTEKTNSIYTIS